MQCSGTYRRGGDYEDRRVGRKSSEDGQTKTTMIHSEAALQIAVTLILVAMQALWQVSEAVNNEQGVGTQHSSDRANFD